MSDVPYTPEASGFAGLGFGFYGDVSGVEIQATPELANIDLGFGPGVLPPGVTPPEGAPEPEPREESDV